MDRGIRSIVCIKQVPEIGDVRLDPKTHTLIRENVSSIINPFDLFAVEEAVRIKERYGGTVTAVTMGPSQAEDVLITSFMMGADKGLLLSDSRLAGSDTWVTAVALAALIKQLAYDLVICGLETADSSTAQVGPELAEKLNIPQVTYVYRIELEQKKRTATLTRETDTGYQIVRGRLPILVSVVKGINTPREPDSELAKGKTSELISLKALGLDRGEFGADLSPTRVIEVNRAMNRRRAQLVIESQLPAHEKIKRIIMGGIEQKDKNFGPCEKGEDLLRKVGEYILNIIKSEGIVR